MKAVKIVLNSLIAGAFSAVLLALLIADLNVDLRLTPLRFFGLTIRLAVTYGAWVGLAAVAVFLLVQFFSNRRARVAWIYPSFLTLSFSLLTLLFVALLRANYRHYLSFFDQPVRSALRAQMIELALLGAAGAALCIGLRRYWKRRLVFSVYVGVLLAGVILAYGQRYHEPGAGPAAGRIPLQGRRSEKRVTIIGLEGVTRDILTGLISKGRLPNFAWLMENGASAGLASFSPNERTALGASFDTGKLPAKHRRFSDVRYSLLGMKETIEIAPRYMLFKQLTRLGLLRALPSRAAPAVKDIWQILWGNRISFVKRGPAETQAAAAPGEPCLKFLENAFSDPELLRDPNFSVVRNAFLRDCASEEAAVEEKARVQPQLQYFLLDGLDTAETYFYKFSFPQQFGTIGQDALNKYGPVIERYYAYYDALIGKYLTSLKEEDLLVVYSPHGMAPLPVWKRFVEMALGDPRVSADHESAPDGIVFFYGRDVRRGRRAARIDIVDIAPTLLYCLGLPVGRDMDGLAATPLFTDEFIRENPIIYISSYEDVRILPPQ